MTNKEFLKRASKLQKEIAEIYNQGKSGLCSITAYQIRVTAKKFHELEKENVIEHVSKELNGIEDMWAYEAMTPDGVKIIAVEWVDQVERR